MCVCINRISFDTYDYQFEIQTNSQFVYHAKIDTRTCACRKLYVYILLISLKAIYFNNKTKRVYTQTHKHLSMQIKLSK